MGTATSKRGPTALHHVKGGHPSIVTQVDNGAISILRDRAGLGFGLALGETLISNGALIWEVLDRIVGVGLPRQAVQHFGMTNGRRKVHLGTA